MDEDESSAGRSKPPHSGRFRPGQSGNPRGRPKGRQRSAPYEAVLGQMVNVRENGANRRVSAAEAFVLFVVQQGLAGNDAAIHTAMKAIEAAKASRAVAAKRVPMTTVRKILSVGSVNAALEVLRGGVVLDRFRQTAHLALEPWLVEAALSRLERELSQAEQKVVWKATRTPHKVVWPDWWTYHP